MSYIFKVKVMSGICFKQTFLCVEQLYNISLKYKLYVVYFSKKNFFVLNNYVIYLKSISYIHCNYVMYIFKVKVISGICFKQTFLCVQQVYHISLKYKLYVVYVLKKISLY